MNVCFRGAKLFTALKSKCITRLRAMIAHLHSPIHLISIESRTNVRASLGSLSERVKDKYDFE